MAYDLEEQERLAELKAWWATYGKKLIALTLLVIMVIAGWRLYTTWQGRQALEASALYEQLDAAMRLDEKDKATVAYQALQERYARTTYASMAALLMAEQSFSKKDLSSARHALEWIVNKGRHEEIKAVARLRLAGILLDEKKYEEALKVLTAKVPGSFAPLYADRRGDIYVEQKKVAEARKQFQSALESLETTSPLRRAVEFKLDALGEV